MMKSKPLRQLEDQFTEFATDIINQFKFQMCTTLKSSTQYAFDERLIESGIYMLEHLLAQAIYDNEYQFETPKNNS